MFKVGDRVKINSKFGGMYDGLTGTVKENNPTIWYVRIELDVPILLEKYDLEIKEEVFYPSELLLIE